MPQVTVSYSTHVYIGVEFYSHVLDNLFCGIAESVRSVVVPELHAIILNFSAFDPLAAGITAYF